MGWGRETRSEAGKKGGDGEKRRSGRKATQWTWAWVDSGSWWWMGKPGVLRFMGSQRVGHSWATELNWTELKGSTGSLLPLSIDPSSWKSKSPQCIFKERGIKAPGKPLIQGIFTQRPWSCDRSHLASPFHPSNNILLLLPDKLSQECRSTDEVYKMICIHALSQHCQCKWQLFKKTVPNIPTEGTNQA